MKPGQTIQPKKNNFAIQEIPGFKKKPANGPGGPPLFKGPMGIGGPGRGPVKMTLAGIEGKGKAGPSPMKSLFP